MPPTSPIRYRVTPLDLHAHLFEVRCTVDDPDAAGQRFRLATWVPGSYLIREFARHFVAVSAHGDAGSVVLEKVSKDTWQAAPCRGPLTFVANAYAFDLSVRTAYLDATRGFFNGGAVFVCPEGRDAAPCTLEIVLPKGEACSAWRIATTMPEAGPNRYCAANHDELIDHPVEMSAHASCAFTAGGVSHEIAVTGSREFDSGRLAADVARICQWQIDLFGSTAPFDRYLFQVMAVGDGYGGLEHRASTSLLCRRDSLPRHGMAEATDDYVNFLGLASHEYFHAWNVKRIKPAAFTPYDLARENYTRQLWAFEGITSYYDDLALVRSGVITPARYLDLLGRAITTVTRTPGRGVQSVAEASFDAWIKFYRPDENSPNAGVSYYGKGSLVALALDLTLRSDNGKSLDDVMRLLWRRYGTTCVGVPEDGIEQIAEELAGRDLSDFFARYVFGTEDPPLAELLAGHGVALAMRAANGPADRGGKAAGSGPGPRCWIGAKVGGDHRLQHVYSNGPAERAGLAPGDTLVAFDGIKASTEGLATVLERRAPGESVGVHAFRRDELLHVDLLLDAAPLDTCYLTTDDAASGEARRRRDAWLGVTG